MSDTQLPPVIYSIRNPENPSIDCCGRCGVRFRVAGPTGYADDVPICDRCLLAADTILGIVLALVSIVRCFATSDYATREDYWSALGEVGTFSRLFERVTSQTGPPRVFRLSLSSLPSLANEVERKDR